MDKNAKELYEKSVKNTGAVVRVCCMVTDFEILNYKTKSGMVNSIDEMILKGWTLLNIVNNKAEFLACAYTKEQYENKGGG